MDPALQELQKGSPGAVIEAVIRLHDPAVVPPQVRLVAQFGLVATCRLYRRDIAAVWSSSAVVSLKASRLIAREPELESFTSPSLSAENPTFSSPQPADYPSITGEGTIVAVADWGFDFTHPNFLNPDGTTRFLAIWDQSAPGRGATKYGYGRVYTEAEINAALRTEAPFKTLGYHPAKADPSGEGTHGTHVFDIACGNGTVGPSGMAPQARMLGVHMAADAPSEHTTLADSVHLLEALDFFGSWAGDRCVVVNMSMGRHGGPHDGLTSVEQAIDAWLEARPGRAVVQSSGNYYQAQTHSSGRVEPGQPKTLHWIIDAADSTPNELEVWYSGHDEFRVEITIPGRSTAISVPLGDKQDITDDGRLIGRIYHRAKDPNNGNHHIDVFMYRHAPPGIWLVTLVGEDVVDGRFHAWIERDAGCYGCQSRFAPEDVDPRFTTGTICNGFRTIAVGAYDAHSPDAAVGSFSSSGPTVSGRIKPDVCAQGVAIVAARSSPAQALRAGPDNLLTRKSGTSMAAPRVAGVVARMFQALGRPLPIHITRRLLLATTDQPATDSPPDRLRYGQGLLNPERAVAAALAYRASLDPPTPSSSFLPLPAMETNFTEAVQSAGSIALQSGQALPLRYDDTAVVAQATDLDSALRQALAGPAGVYLVLGNLAGGTLFRVFRLEPATPAPTPALPPLGLVMEYVGAPAAAAALLASQGGQGRVFLPANVVAPAARWVEVPHLSEFYKLAAADQTAQRNIWVRRLFNIRAHIALAGATITQHWLRSLGTPVLRLLVAQFAEHALPVRAVNQPHERFLGARAGGLTKPTLPLPLSEPGCYLPVISVAEGSMETINAYDLGAGLSLGPIQFNAQRSELMRFLGHLQQQDPALFQQEFGGPLGWSIRRVGTRTDILVNAGQPDEIALIGDSAHAPHNIGFLESGRLHDSDFDQIDAAFRHGLTVRFRNVVAWPHVQELVAEVAAWWLAPGLQQIHEPINGIPVLDPAQPDEDLFVLKALLLSAYVRYSACLSRILEHLRPFPTVAEKLANFRAVLAANSGDWGPCRDALRRRLIRRLFEDNAQHISQHTAARNTWAVIQRMPVAPVVLTEAWDDIIREEMPAEWAHEDLYDEVADSEAAAAPCGCGGHARAAVLMEEIQEADWDSESCAEGCGCGSACGAGEDTFYEDYLNPATAFVLGAMVGGSMASNHPAAPAPTSKSNDEDRTESGPEIISEADWEADWESDEEDDTEADDEADYGDHLVELAEVSLDADPGSVSALLQRVVFANSPSPLAPTTTPGLVFDAFLSQGPAELRQQLSNYLTLIALPRQVLVQDLRPGDILLQRAYGEGQTYAALVVAGTLIPFQELRTGQYQAYATQPGKYVHVVEAGPFPKRRELAFVRRVTDAQNRLDFDHMIVRPLRGGRQASAASGFAFPDAVEDLSEKAPRTHFRCCNYTPSAGRQAFHAAITASNWSEAFRNLNGLSMYEIMCALGSLARTTLDAFWEQRTTAAGDANVPRLDFAHTAVVTGLLPATAPGDLESTGQVNEAAEFLSERLMPEAEKVNSEALPHLALILKECRFYGVTDKSHVAYILASAHHESGVGKSLSEKYNGNADNYFNGKYQGRLGNDQPGDGSRFRGRGYVQLTGRVNYARYTDILSATRFTVDLIGNPVQAAEPSVAAPILVHGLVNGRFTGKSLADFGTDGDFKFKGARAIVNGDVAKNGPAIAAIARRYRKLLDYKPCV
ncbi:S8 family serine peptidase [Hymenobacter sp. BT664]|uniref:S8 family serine peptidase n=1 Tax=Hymenobacter montanus TaxID=2771359 RepID=A0A927BDC0_9BACT|nr:S8 family serine peptidase [Hymenobacter montanus]MBD2768079.1 S8 family serine peptidase [Hymenobacter montanus]